MNRRIREIGLSPVARFCLAGFALVFFAGTGKLAAEAPDYTRDVRPILSEYCYPCHGPDAAAREGGFRFDQVRDAINFGAITPGDPSDSLMVERLLTEEPRDVMPPPSFGRSLSPDQIETLVAWIREGAPYEDHWAFQPVQREEPPAVESDWVRDPIDAFVLARLREEGLQPSSEADRSAWYRRVSFDLTGLPPALEALDAFLADQSAGAYERAVDGLLASPHFGEHMAVDWLDAARYADTYGYQDDRPSEVWPWRDWAIRAFNDNLPYDEFIRWQVAGDLLPDATQDQRLATAFNRLHRQTNEGGSIEEEFRVAYAADRVETLGTAVLGLTMECARCHDHKFDPISHRDYFRFFSFFNNIDESGMYSHFTDATPTPSMFLYGEGQAEQHAELRAAVREAEAALEKAPSRNARGFRKWVRSDRRATPEASPLVRIDFDTVAEDGTPVNTANAERAPKMGGVALADDAERGRVAEFGGENAVTVENVAQFDRFEPFSIALWLNAAEHVPQMIVCHTSKAEIDAANRGYEIFLQDGRPVFSLNHFWPGNAVRVRGRDVVPLNMWTHLAVTYDGSSRADGMRIYVNGEAVETETIRDNLRSTIRYSGGQPPLTFGARFRDYGFQDGRMDDLRVYNQALSEPEVQAVYGGIDVQAAIDARIAAGQTDALAEYYWARIHPEYAEAREHLADARAEEARFADGLRQVMVMEEMPEPRTAYVLHRGEYNQKRDAVEPGTPDWLPPFPENAPPNRLGLAEWITDPAHPLTARVAVNRLWRQTFGRGLVATLEDFGVQGEPPTHPELLDYLAAEFVASGWDQKAMLRRLVLSATYRQRSEASAEALQRDPENALLARGPSYRRSSEEIRDAALAASGLLVPKVGGPSVKPYQPEGLWRDASHVTYTPDQGEGLYRRSMYTYIKRTVPPPSMMTFDATDREVCTVRREITITPLQALVLLNDPQYVEASRALAERILREHGAGPEAMTALFRMLTSRTPHPREADILRQLLEEQRDWFASHPDEAEAYLSVGESPRDASLDVIETAAWTALAQAVMNLDESQVTR